MQEAVADAGLGRGDVKAIGIANQRETTVVWERSTDTSVHPAIVWQSRQTAPQCELMTRAGLEATIRERTGLVIDPYFSGSKIRWILERYPDTIEKARSGELLSTIDTWLIWQLTGGAAHVTDPTNTSRTLLYNIHDREWDPVLLEALDIPRAMLPEVRSSAGLFGETRVVRAAARRRHAGYALDRVAAGGRAGPHPLRVWSKITSHFWPPIHPVWRYSSVEYCLYAPSLRLASRARCCPAVC